jgi:hypothetical protein
MTLTLRRTVFLDDERGSGAWERECPLSEKRADVICSA